jgi:hypothetical protein
MYRRYTSNITYTYRHLRTYHIARRLLAHIHTRTHTQVVLETIQRLRESGGCPPPPAVAAGRGDGGAAAAAPGAAAAGDSYTLQRHVTVPPVAVLNDLEKSIKQMLKCKVGVRVRAMAAGIYATCCQRMNTNLESKG